MVISFQDYTDYGYDLISEMAWKRWYIVAYQIVTLQTFNRVNEETLVDGSDLAQRNRWGICELADLLYTNSANLKETASGGAMKSFTNEGYSETFATASLADLQALLAEGIQNTLSIFFESWQLFRGGGSYFAGLEGQNNNL